jgi:hypothetical protein
MTTLMIKIFMTFLNQFLKGMLDLQRKSQFQILETQLFQLIKCISFTSIGIALRHGESSASLMSMM